MPKVSREARLVASLEEVVITPLLGQRPARLPNLAAEHTALVELANLLVRQPQKLLDRLCQAAVELCDAGSAGVSLLEEDENGQQFRWVAMAGTYAPHVGGVTPRDFSPCGNCIDRGASQLYSHPEKYFTYFAEVEPYMVEGLVVPFGTHEQVLGTIWVVFHEEDHRGFDNEDVRIMESLAAFTAAGLQQARLRSEAEAAHAYLRTIFESTGDSILVADEDGRYTDANSAAEQLLGYDRNELKTMDVTQVVHAEPNWTHAEYQRFVETGQWRGEITLKRKDGTTIPAEAHASTVDAPSGTAYVSIIRDLSERKETENLHQQFLATIGHELRSPLAPIIGYAHLMLKTGEFDRTFMEAILGLARRLQRQIGDLLDTSSFESGNLKLIKDDVDLGDVIKGVLENIRLLAPNHRLVLSMPDSPVVGSWDSVRLEQVLENLLSNAVKYSEEGTQVRVSAQVLEGEVEVQVEDEGVGIGSNEMGQLFHRFHRIPTAKSKNAKGIGLGLFASKIIVEAHGGRIWADSDGPGRGSRFILRLPLNAISGPNRG